MIFTHAALSIGVYDAGVCGLDGDVTCDCVVNLDDLLIVPGNFGLPGGAARADGDLDGDGDVDLDDLLSVLGSFGAQC